MAGEHEIAAYGRIVALVAPGNGRPGVYHEGRFNTFMLQDAMDDIQRMAAAGNTVAPALLTVLNRAHAFAVTGEHEQAMDLLSQTAATGQSVLEGSGHVLSRPSQAKPYGLHLSEPTSERC